MQTRAVGRAVLVGLPVAPNGLVSAASGPGEAQWSWRRRQRAGFEDGCRDDIWARALGFPVARRWGRLSAELGHEGADLLIAATALEHGLAVATRNVRHFKPSRVEVVNPFAAVS